MTGTFRTLSLIAQMCSVIDRLFVENVGPFGQMVIEETRATWLASGNKTRTTDVNDYIALLAKEIENPFQRTEFVAQAKRSIGVTHPHPTR